MLADAFDTGFQEPPGNKLACWAGIAAIVQGTERHLRTGTGFQGSEVVPQGLSGLRTFPFQHINGVLQRFFVNLIELFDVVIRRSEIWIFRQPFGNRNKLFICHMIYVF